MFRNFLAKAVGISSTRSSLLYPRITPAILRNYTYFSTSVDSSINASEQENNSTLSNNNTSDMKKEQFLTTNNDAEVRIQEKDKRILELQDSYLRVLADMENLRMRTKKEVENGKQFAVQSFAKDVIGVVDILELALESAKPTTSNDSCETSSHLLQDVVNGLSLTLAEAQKVLAKNGVMPIDPLHQKFDPNFHTALFEIPNSDLEESTVLSVQKKGYLLHHRVIRPASVGISKKT